jgi:tetratricopeptide (TPR) repeat protein
VELAMRTISVSLLVVLLTQFAFPQSTNVDLSRAEQLLQAGDSDAAIAKLNDIAARDPHAIGLNRYLGIAFYRKKDYLKAVEYLNRAVQENTADSDATRLLGMAYYLTGQPAAAIPYLRKAGADGKNREVAFALGLCYAINHQYEPALDMLGRLFGTPARSAASRLVLARVLLLQGLDPAAEEQAKLALKEARATPLAHFVLGQVYLYRSDLPRAVAEFQAELTVNPGSSVTAMRLGDAYLRSGRLDEAEASLQRSLWLDGGNAETYTLMGKVLVEKKQFSAAVPMLAHALAQEPNRYTTHYLLGEAYLRLGKFGLSRQEMKIGTELQKSPPAGMSR